MHQIPDPQHWILVFIKIVIVRLLTIAFLIGKQLYEVYHTEILKDSYRTGNGRTGGIR
jgi:hypothetical protein